ncbi:sulfatase-like hydrolase/transferase [Roseburia sp. MUC/MUC-530-WT-4D]|uniref:Sulfatase-like hydrolase/transferase n=1 Tax=Roseburia porci TaxID=2605790 RepID=A0A6L5YUB3_9FIRM|nr:sulfatase-like hydrolase/transferase [Roseburia porci]
MKRGRKSAGKIAVLLANFFLTVLAITLLLNGLQFQEKIDIELNYGKQEIGRQSEAQLFYAENLTGITEENSYIVHITENKALFHVKELDYSNNFLRIDPTNQKEDYEIKSITFYYNDEELFSLKGKELVPYMLAFENVEYTVKDDVLKVHAKNDDSRITFKKDFSTKIVNEIMYANMKPYYLMVVFYFVFGILQIVFYPAEEKRKMRWYHWIGTGIAVIFLFLGLAMNYGVYYLETNFGDVPIGQLIYHMHTPLEGTNTSSFAGIAKVLIIIFLIVMILIVGVYKALSRIGKRGTFLLWSGLLGVVLGAYAIGVACYHFNFWSYLQYIGEDTTLYDDYYVDGRDIQLTFPEKKRNLVYIYLESMEMTYANRESGGAMMENYIPELTDIALENECFGDGEQLNGAYTLPGATFTMGALVAQTSGVIINENIVSNDTLNAKWESENNYLPGIWAIGDILNEQGYNQEFMIGSDGKFAGRSSYFAGHGNYDIFDYYTAIDKNYIDKDYYEWWGFEDKKLFKYAKNEIQKLSKEDAPFNFTMLTVDTHFTGGYVCDLCEQEYNDQYSNVIACSSAQVAEFLDWLSEQDFYEDTTVVISGDHLTMDSDYISKQGADLFDRRTYVAIVNGDVVNTQSNIQRKYTTVDLFPTTLAAMGVKIEGNRLGLGVNLYSGEKTLYERYGKDYLEVELLKDSKLYRQKLLYGNTFH